MTYNFFDEHLVTRVSTITGIDATSVATTLLYTVPVGYVFIPLMVVIRVTAFTAGSKSTQAVASFGGNSATYDDFLDSVTYTITAANKCLRDAPDDAAEFDEQAAGDEFKISIETGSDADVETWAVDVFGYLVDEG